MMLTIGFIVIVAWSGFVLATAGEYGRRPNRIQRVAAVVAVLGVAFAVPVVLLGSFGVPDGWSYHWLGRAALLGQAGLIGFVLGVCCWLVADTAFVWSHRRRVFPFAFRGGPGGEG